MKRSCASLLVVFAIASALAQNLREELLQALDKTPHPTNAASFKAVPHLPCLNQGKTSVCWSFATCSFLESEMARLQRSQVRLSVMYPAYCQYVEKARRYVQTKGESRFSAGDLFTGVADACRQYGIMPADAYDKQPRGQMLDQNRLYSELETSMQEVKRQSRWNDARVLSQVKKILNRHLGEPPRTFPFNGSTYTAQSFRDEVVRLPWHDYVMVTSFESAPFNTFTELKVPDNWQHNSNFFNVPLSVFYNALKDALQAGFSAAIDMDNTEPSYADTGRYCLIPDCDIPWDQINQTARELRFRNGATEDDHAIHIIGYENCGGADWFLAKDSWKTTWRDGNNGCLFLHGGYVKLKVLAFLVHRDGVPQVTAALPKH